MSTELVNWEAKLAEKAQAAAKNERPSAGSIGIRAGVLSYNGQVVPGNKLDCIIVAATHTNLFYEDKFDPNNLSNPICYAYGETEAEMAPHPKAEKPQADSCAECPMNKWGSDPNGGRGKACKNSRSLALVPADTTPDDIQTAELAVLKLPVMSVKHYGDYVHKVSTLFNRPPLGVVTQISTVPDQKSQFKVTFSPLKEVGDELLGGLFGREESARAALERVYEPNPTAAEAAPAKKSKY